MSQKIAEGDTIQIASRETSAADSKSGLFYPHFCGLIGTVTKIYADGTANISVDPQSLPADIRKRHQEGTNGMRQKWLDGLSEEGRNRLSGAEKKFDLRYSLLVAVSDLSPYDGGVSADGPRKSLADLEADEARHLEEVAQKRKAA
jgi:hypothetical protein